METKNTPESKGGRESSLRIDTEAKQQKGDVQPEPRVLANSEVREMQ